MTQRSLLTVSLIAATIACQDSALEPGMMPDAALAKGGTSVQRANFSITDAGLSLVSDGKGEYRHGICGVVGVWDAGSVTHLGLAEGRVPKSQQASCAGIAPRTASVTLALRHISDDPHVDDAENAPGSGVFSVGNLKFGWGAAMATTINASGSTPFCGSIGLRFTPITYPGSSSIVREDLGGGRWHMYTRPWPDNIGYCENGGVAAYWHVSFSLMVQILGG